MPNYKTVAFTLLELKGLWIRATGGTTSSDVLLDQAAEAAIDKVYRTEKGMPRKGHAPGTTHRGPELDLRREA
jgi:hypothetical protein